MVDARAARIVRMLDDPRLTGDLLLIGIAMAAELDFRRKWIKFEDVARHAFGPDDMSQRKARWVIKEDIRRYQVPQPDRLDRCQGPMPRAPFCRRTATWRTTVCDWATGERSMLLACNRHQEWFELTARRNRDSKPETVPLPPANKGGVLRPHLPEIDWPRAWRSLDPRWVEHPEAVPWPKPTFHVVLGGGQGGGPPPSLKPL